MVSYAGNVKVVGADGLCFPANPTTLEPLRCGCYDPYPWQGGEGAVAIISDGEWSSRRAAMREQEMRRARNGF